MIEKILNDDEGQEADNSVMGDSFQPDAAAPSDLPKGAVSLGAAPSCRQHLNMLRAIDWKARFPGATLEEWSDQLRDCVLRHAQELTRRDLVEAFALQDVMRTSIQVDSLANTAIEDEDQKAEAVAEANKRCNTDYDALVSRYNGLVGDDNNLLDTARHLANAPAIILSAPIRRSIHCNGMNLGSMSTLDCY